MKKTTVMHEVVIVGAGPCGLTAANLLAQAGVDVLIVERNLGTVEQPRAVSIDDEALRTMQAAQIVAEVLADLAPDYGSDFVGPGGEILYRVQPTTREYGFPRRSAVAQPILEATLRTCFERRESAKTLFGWTCSELEQQNDWVTLTIENGGGEKRELCARYVIGADGGRSFVRDAIGAQLEGETYRQRWLIVDLEGTRDMHRQSVAMSDPRRPYVNLPGPDGRRRFEFMLHPDETDAEVTDEVFVRDLLARCGPDRDAHIVRKQVYTFHARVVDKWQQGRVFLIGDAAHLSPPFAGQGLNSGIRDAHNIAWKLAAVVKGDLGPGLLASYQPERERHARALINLAVRNGRLLMTKPGLSGWLVRNRYRWANRIPAVSEYYRQMRNKPKAAYDRGFVLPGPVSAWSGRMVVQPRLERVDRSLTMMDDMIGRDFAVVAYGPDAQAMIDELQGQDWTIPNLRFLAITPWNYNLRRDWAAGRRQDGPRLFAGRDLDAEIERAGLPVDHVLVIRPDRYILADKPFAQARSLLAADVAALVRQSAG